MPAGSEAAIRDAIEALPAQVRSLLDKAKTKVVFAERMADVLSPAELAEHPRGYEAGATWANAEGGLFRTHGIVVCRTYVDFQTGQVRENHRLAGAFRHEAGHQLDVLLSDPSHGDDWKRAYNRDVTGITDGDRLRYYLQPGDAGREETFAELAAVLIGGGSDEVDVLAAFPSCGKRLRNWLGLGRRR